MEDSDANSEDQLLLGMQTVQTVLMKTQRGKVMNQELG